MSGSRETPRARTSGLVVKTLSDEVLVYDLARHRAHSLNRAAAAVWHRLDGRTSIDELARHVREDLGGPADESAVWLALKELDRAHLLEGPLRVPAAHAVSRRQWLRRVGVAAGASAVLVPTVSSIVAPHAYAQISAVGCPTPDSCSTRSCAGTCACAPTTERTNVCVVPTCASATPCTASSDCQPGQVCTTVGCCGPTNPFCIPIAPAGFDCPTELELRSGTRRWG